MIDDRTAPNTPPTPPSHLPSPPLHATEAGFPVSNVDQAQAAARREQSDQASSLIGQRLLQGWALLDAQCENETCFAVPLMRRPAFKPKVADAETSKNGSASAPVAKVMDPRRYCVICHRDYLREGEVEEYERYIEATQGKSALMNQAAKPVAKTDEEPEGRVSHSAAAKKRRFAAPANPTASIRAQAGQSQGGIPVVANIKGKQRAREVCSTSRISPAAR